MGEKITELEEGQQRIEKDLKEFKEETKERLDKVEKDISFLREEVRIGFHTLNDTLNAMFNITASSVKANKEVAEIMENAYSEASGRYAEIKSKQK